MTEHTPKQIALAKKIARRLYAKSETVNRAVARRAALAAIVEVSELAGWQPIETAPKDGTYIWLANHANLRLGFYEDGYPWVDLGLAEQGGVRGLRFTPTNWMPTPKLPVKP